MVCAIGVLASGCGRGMLDGQSPQADRIALLWWLLLSIATVVFFAVTALLGYALFRRRGGATSRFEREPRSEMMFIIGGGGVIPLVLLVVVFAATIATMAAASNDGSSDEMQIDVIGHDFWWEVRYPGQQATAENVIHVPVGRDVRFNLKSDDVIHSFWVPQLNGKTDMIPGSNNSTVIKATTAGAYQGRCAEFCGIGHACMTFILVAEEQAQFDQWIAAQRARSGALPDPQTQDNGECVGPKASGVTRPGDAASARAKTEGAP